MLKNLLSTFAKKALYALAAVLIAFLLQSIQAFHPTDPLQVKIWQWIVLPALVGLVGLLKRLLTWDPAKAEK
jgi:hypothetical protein